MKNKVLLLGGVIILIVAVVGIIAVHNNKQNISDKSSTTPPKSSTSSSSVATTQSTIENYMFMPMSISVKTGSTVTWTNKDSVGHTVTDSNSSENGPSSSLLSENQTYSFKFTTAGTYHIKCSVHPYMTQTVTVSS